MIGISGYWYLTNYGAALTAFALARQLEKMGENVIFIDLPTHVFHTRDDYRDDNSPTRNFISKQFVVSKRYNSSYDLYELNDICDTFLLGSDQMWNWSKDRYLNEGGFYLLDFVDDKKKVIAYATSFGKENFDGSFLDKTAFRTYLRRFDALSVRESSGIKLVKELADKNATLVTDPVFFLSAEEYGGQSSKSGYSKISPEKYIFVYMLQPTAEKQKIVKEVSHAVGLKIIAVGDLDSGYKDFAGTSDWEIPRLNEICIEDWLCLIKNSDYVITDSFHGFCFSLIFEKRFIALKPRDGSSRFLSLAEYLNVKERLFFIGDRISAEIITKEVDYEVVAKRLRKFVRKSRDWLRNALVKKKSNDDYECDCLLRAYQLDKRLFSIENAHFGQQLELLWKKYGYLKDQVIQGKKLATKFYLLNRLHGKNVAIRGGGIHTIELLKIIGREASVVCIWDPYSRDDYLEDIPLVKCFDDIKKYGSNLVLISSYKYRNEMLREIDELGCNIEIFDMYGEMAKEGIVYDSEFYLTR